MKEHIYRLLPVVAFCSQMAVAQFVDPQTPANAQPVSGGTNWVLVFSDEFNTNALDTTKWGVDVSASTRSPRTDRGINDWWWKAENVSMDGSNVVLSVVKHDADTMYCGSISSDGKFEPQYGYLEARVEIADSTKDTHTAFWLQGAAMGNIDGTGNDGAEVDIFESAWLGDYTKSVVHIDGYGASHQASTIQYTTPGLHTGYHVFGLEWAAGMMKIYYDGVHKVTYTGKWVPQTNEWIWLSDGASFGDIGTFTNEPVGFLTSAKFDYVRVWAPPANYLPEFTADPIVKSGATIGFPYSNSLAGAAWDADLDSIIYSKESGPGWLTISANGDLSGVPASSDAGTNTWQIKATDTKGGNDTATLTLFVMEPGTPIVLVGGSVLNGDFNANPGAAITYVNTPVWYNMAGNQTAVATWNDQTYDGSQNAVVQSGRRPGLDTGYAIAAGDSFDIRYVWKDDFNWVDGTDQITYSLFVTSDNTITGSRSNLVVHTSGISTVNNAYQLVSVDGIYSASAAVAGKTLFIALETTSAGFARVDNVELIVHPWVPTCTLTGFSDFGVAFPSGVTTPFSNSLVAAWISGSPVVIGSTQYFCTGWAGTGSAGSGSGTNASFTITQDSTLTWLWQTNYYINLGITEE